MSSNSHSLIGYTLLNLVGWPGITVICAPMLIKTVMFRHWYLSADVEINSKPMLVSYRSQSATIYILVNFGLQLGQIVDLSFILLVVVVPSHVSKEKDSLSASCVWFLDIFWGESSLDPVYIYTFPYSKSFKSVSSGLSISLRAIVSLKDLRTPV